MSNTQVSGFTSLKRLSTDNNRRSNNRRDFTYSLINITLVLRTLLKIKTRDLIQFVNNIVIQALTRSSQEIYKTLKRTKRLTVTVVRVHALFLFHLLRCKLFFFFGRNRLWFLFCYWFSFSSRLLCRLRLCLTCKLCNCLPRSFLSFNVFTQVSQSFLRHLKLVTCISIRIVVVHYLPP